MKALIEACAGNFKNQEVAFKCQIIYSINIILLMECKNQTQKTPEAHVCVVLAIEIEKLFFSRLSYQR